MKGIMAIGTLALSGLSDYNIGYLNINGGGNIDKAVSVEIR